MDTDVVSSSRWRRLAFARDVTHREALRPPGWAAALEKRGTRGQPLFQLNGPAVRTRCSRQRSSQRPVLPRNPQGFGAAFGGEVAGKDA